MVSKPWFEIPDEAEVKVRLKRGKKDQDTFDHDKGQKSAISGRRLHWRLSTGFFAFSPVFMCNLVRRVPYNLEKVEKFQWRKSRQILSRLWLSWFFRTRKEVKMR